LLVMFIASSMCIPLINSVAYAELAMADPQPNALKTALSMMPVSSFTSTWNFSWSPQAIDPTSPILLLI
jgi:hypothetical protein